jgi:endogenous inhibitor of DNA gyrase (YacG/DUF329 family)
MSVHGKKPENVLRQKKLMDKIRPLTKKWHASDEGRAWHKAHGILGWINRKPIEIICKQCGKTSQTKTLHQEFCSNACKSKWRRVSGLDNIKINCKTCGIEFEKSKYSKQIYCSKTCVHGFTNEHASIAFRLRDQGLTFQSIGNHLKTTRKTASDLVIRGKLLNDQESR